MNGWQEQAMMEAEKVKLWEPLIAERQECANWCPAISKLCEARSLIADAIGKLALAAEWTAGTVAEDRIMSLATGLDELDDCIYGQIRNMEKEGG